MTVARPRFLASVRSVAEARLAAALGAELIDLKEPRRGALGAVPAAEQRRILAALGEGRPIVSATVGDHPFAADRLAGHLRRAALTGVDIVKFGVHAGWPAARPAFMELDRRLRLAPPRARLVVLLLADRLGGLNEALALAEQALRVHGVAGVMLDTAAKGSGARPLPEVFSDEELSRFVAAVHAGGGFAGLAGCLGPQHIASLVGSGADILGFRGALCAGTRSDGLDAGAFVAVRDQLWAARAAVKAAVCAA